MLSLLPVTPIHPKAVVIQRTLRSVALSQSPLGVTGRSLSHSTKQTCTRQDGEEQIFVSIPQKDWRAYGAAV